MTRFTRVRLEPNGPFHFGGRGVGMEHSDVALPGDSLFSALCIAIAEAASRADLEALLARFGAGGGLARPPFRLTSLMPYAGGVYFLPYPMVRPPDDADMARRKQFKGIQWVSEAVFKALVAGESIPASALEAGGAPVTLVGGKACMTAQERDALKGFVGRDPETGAEQAGVLWRKDSRPRVAVDRVTSASAVYATGATYFNRNATARTGLYTVIEWLEDDATLRKTVRAAFQRLGEAGIGGERSSGHGQFEPVTEELAEWDIGARPGSYFVTLAPYHPSASEHDVIGEGARYEIMLRRGWLSLPGHSNLRRATVRMIAEGGVLHRPADGGKVLGDLADVTPKPLEDAGGPHIYRYGLAFPVMVADGAMRPDKRGRGGGGAT
jgi:CRISPR-associated protein Csm4